MQIGRRGNVFENAAGEIEFGTVAWAEKSAGPIIAQAAVPVLADDTPETLAERILVAEHRLYPFALRMVASGTARLEGGRVVLKEEVNQADFLYSPMV